MSLKLMICGMDQYIQSGVPMQQRRKRETHVFMAQVLEQLELSVSPFRQNRCAERLHDLLDSDGLASQLIARRADRSRIPVSMRKRSHA